MTLPGCLLVSSFTEILWCEGVFDGFELIGGEAVFGFGNLVPLGDHRFEALGVFGGEVVELGAVFGEVVEFPAAHFCGGDFPVAGTEGAVFREVEVEGVMGFAFLSGEDGEEGFADEGIDAAGFNVNPSDESRVRGLRYFEGGGHEVDNVGGLVGDFSERGISTDRAVSWNNFRNRGDGRFKGIRNVNDEGGRDAAFVLVLFVEAEGGVAEVGPADVVAPVGFGVPGFEFFAAGAVEGAGSVVGAEHDEGVVVEAFCFEVGDEATDVLVEDIDHGGVDFHAVFFPLLVFGGKAVPGGDVGGAGGKLPFGGEEAGLELFFVAALAEDVPAFGVFAFVFFDVGFGGLERVVGSVVGAVQEERVSSRPDEKAVLICVSFFFDFLEVSWRVFF